MKSLKILIVAASAAAALVVGLGAQASAPLLAAQTTAAQPGG